MVGRPEDTSASYSGISFEDTVARTAEIAVGYLTVVSILFYPIGVVTLSLQIWNTHLYEMPQASRARVSLRATFARGLTQGVLPLPLFMNCLQEVFSETKFPAHGVPGNSAWLRS
jgi:hypothetical protein